MMAYEDDDIDRLKLPAAVKLAKETHIKLNGLKDLEEIKCELKKHLLSDRRNRHDVIQNLQNAAEEDSKVRQELMKIYQKSLDSLDIKSSDNPLIKSVSKCYKKTDVIHMLKNQKGKLDGKLSRCPVLVLGDTGAGKSSFINLLLGQEVFPCSLLSNTSIICEISYCDEPFATLYPYDDEESIVEETIRSNTMEDFDFKKLSALVQHRDDIKKRSRYKKAEICFPLSILKTGLRIVDSPGVGDTEEMTDLVLDYLMEASAFVFIINTIDGVQISRLEMFLEQLVKRVMTGDKYYRPDCTMFICNKWDQVPVEERKSVYEDAVKKLTKVWIGFKESQLYTLSTKEALWIQREGHIVGRFEKILQGIVHLLPPSRELLLTLSTGLLYEFLKNCMTCIESNINQRNIEPEEAKKQQIQMCNQMKALKTEVIDFFDHEKAGMKTSLSKLAEDLSKHLRTDRVMEDLCRFNSKDSEFMNKNFQDVAIVIRSRVYEGVSKHIRLWEDEGKQLEKMGKKLVDSFREKFPNIDAQLIQVEKLFKNNLTNTNESSMEDSIPLVPLAITDRFSNLNIGLKVVLSVALSPVFLIGVIVRLPYWGLKQLAQSIKNEMLSRNFESGDEEARNRAIREYAKNMVSKMTQKGIIDDCLVSHLSELYKYIDKQKEKVLGQIDGRMEMLKTCTMEKDPTTMETWINFKATVETLLKNLEFFNLMFLPQNLKYKSSDDFSVTETLSDGVMTKIVRAKNKMTGDKVAIRQSRITIYLERMKQYQKEERHYRKESKPSLITVNTFIQSDMNIWQCFTPPRSTLRTFMTSKHLDAYNKDKLEFYHKVLNQVALGLDYLHDKDLVHIDLCQDTVMIDDCDRIVLVNISSRIQLDEVLFDGDRTDVSKYVHFPVDILSNPKIIFSKIHDMYSLGIMMLEFWNQRPAFEKQISDNKITKLREFSEYLTSIDIKSLVPSSSDTDNMTSLMNTWFSVTGQCLEMAGDLSARKWIECLVQDPCTPVYNRHGISYPQLNGESSSAQLYSFIH